MHTAVSMLCSFLAASLNLVILNDAALTLNARGTLPPIRSMMWEQCAWRASVLDARHRGAE